MVSSRIFGVNWTLSFCPFLFLILKELLKVVQRTLATKVWGKKGTSDCILTPTTPVNNHWLETPDTIVFFSSITTSPGFLWLSLAELGVGRSGQQRIKQRCTDVNTNRQRCSTTDCQRSAAGMRGGRECEDTGGPGDGGTRPPTTSSVRRPGGRISSAVTCCPLRPANTLRQTEPEQALGAGVDAPLDR